MTLPADIAERLAKLVPPSQAVIDGAMVEAASGATFHNVSPRDGQVLNLVVSCQVEDVERAVAGARAAFEETDPRLAQAARTLGAGELEVFWRISLPMALRGITAGLMLTFARAMGEFGATLMIAGNLPGKTQTLSIAVYDAVQAGNDAQALWLTGVISAVCVLVLVGSGRLLQTRH